MATPTGIFSEHMNAMDDTESLDFMEPPSRPSSRMSISTSDAADTEDNFDTLWPSSQSRSELAAARAFIKRLKLGKDDSSEAEIFVMDCEYLQRVKLFGMLLSTKGLVKKIVTTTPPFTVDSTLLKNIQFTVMSVLLSPKLSSYKGKTVKVHVLAIVLKQRMAWNIPANIESNFADFSELKRVCETELTQRRSWIKKRTRGSVTGKMTSMTILPAHEHQTIFSLGQSIVAETQVPISAELLAKLALVRMVYLTTPGNSYWDEVDIAIASLRERAHEGTTEPKQVAIRLARCYYSILEKDRAEHGCNPPAERNIAEPDDDDESRAFQLTVDSIIANHEAAGRVTTEQEQEPEADSRAAPASTSGGEQTGE